MSNKYDPVFHWNMNEQETQVFKLALMWEEQTKKACPDCKLATLPKHGDPRKCNLYRQCWKFNRETRGLLKQDEHNLYIKANIQIIVANNGRLEPNALCGEKAWIRWKVWKRLFDRKKLEQKGEIVPDKLVVDPKVMTELDCTKRFLFEKCDSEPTFDKIKKFLDNGKMSMWAGGKVSYYYLILSPWIEKMVELQEIAKKYGFDPKVYQQKTSDDVKKYFQQEYAFEFV